MSEKKYEKHNDDEYGKEIQEQKENRAARLI